MSAPVRIEAEAWTDLRFVTLARLLGLAEPCDALIRTARLWSWQTEHYTPDSPTYVVDLDTIESAIGPGAAAALVRARLADEVPEGYRIRGSEGRIEWLWRTRQNGRAGGEATKRKHTHKTGPAGRAPASALPQASPSPLTPDLVPVPDQIRDLSPGAHAIPPAEPANVPAVSPPAPRREDIARTQRPASEPSLDRLWSELEAERQRVANVLGVALQPLLAHDMGRDDLARVLADASTPAKRAELAAQIRHAIAVAGAEFEAEPDKLRWFSGAIFAPRNFRRLVAAPPPKKRKHPARAGPQAAPPLEVPAGDRAGTAELAEAWKALGIQPAKETA